MGARGLSVKLWTGERWEGCRIEPRRRIDWQVLHDEAPLADPQAPLWVEGLGGPSEEPWVGTGEGILLYLGQPTVKALFTLRRGDERAWIALDLGLDPVFEARSSQEGLEWWALVGQRYPGSFMPAYAGGPAVWSPELEGRVDGRVDVREATADAFAGAADGSAQGLLRDRLKWGLGYEVWAARATLAPAEVGSLEHLRSVSDDLMDVISALFQGDLLEARVQARRLLAGSGDQGPAAELLQTLAGWLEPDEIEGALRVLWSERGAPADRRGALDSLHGAPYASLYRAAERISAAATWGGGWAPWTLLLWLKIGARRGQVDVDEILRRGWSLSDAARVRGLVITVGINSQTGPSVLPLAHAAWAEGLVAVGSQPAHSVRLRLRAALEAWDLDGLWEALRVLVPQVGPGDVERAVAELLSSQGGDAAGRLRCIQILASAPAEVILQDAATLSSRWPFSAAYEGRAPWSLICWARSPGKGSGAAAFPWVVESGWDRASASATVSLVLSRLRTSSTPDLEAVMCGLAFAELGARKRTAIHFQAVSRLAGLLDPQRPWFDVHSVAVWRLARAMFQSQGGIIGKMAPGQLREERIDGLWAALVSLPRGGKELRRLLLSCFADIPPLRPLIIRDAAVLEPDPELREVWQQPFPFPDPAELERLVLSPLTDEDALARAVFRVGQWAVAATEREGDARQQPLPPLPRPAAEEVGGAQDYWHAFLEAAPRIPSHLGAEHWRALLQSFDDAPPMAHGRGIENSLYLKLALWLEWAGGVEDPALRGLVQRGLGRVIEQVQAEGIGAGDHRLVSILRCLSQLTVGDADAFVEAWGAVVSIYEEGEAGDGDLQRVLHFLEQRPDLVECLSGTGARQVLQRQLRSPNAYLVSAALRCMANARGLTRLSWLLDARQTSRLLSHARFWTWDLAADPASLVERLKWLLSHIGLGNLGPLEMGGDPGVRLSALRTLYTLDRERALAVAGEALDRGGEVDQDTVRAFLLNRHRWDEGTTQLFERWFGLLLARPDGLQRAAEATAVLAMRAPAVAAWSRAQLMPLVQARLEEDLERLPQDLMYALAVLIDDLSAEELSAAWAHTLCAALAGQLEDSRSTWEWLTALGRLGRRLREQAPPAAARLEETLDWAEELGVGIDHAPELLQLVEAIIRSEGPQAALAVHALVELAGADEPRPIDMLVDALVRGIHGEGLEQLSREARNARIEALREVLQGRLGQLRERAADLLEDAGIPADALPALSYQEPRRLRYELVRALGEVGDLGVEHFEAISRALSSMRVAGLLRNTDFGLHDLQYVGEGQSLIERLEALRQRLTIADRPDPAPHIAPAAYMMDLIQDLIASSAWTGRVRIEDEGGEGSNNPGSRLMSRFDVQDAENILQNLISNALRRGGDAAVVRVDPRRVVVENTVTDPAMAELPWQDIAEWLSAKRLDVPALPRVGQGFLTIREAVRRNRDLSIGAELLTGEEAPGDSDGDEGQAPRLAISLIWSRA